jgi:hypothetical protein
MLKSLWGQTTHRFNVSKTILLAIVPTSQQMLKLYTIYVHNEHYPLSEVVVDFMRPKKKVSIFCDAREE